MPRPQAPFVGPAPIETIETEIFGEGGEGTLIAVTLNRGKPSEQWFTMAPELARRLGNALTGLALALPEHCNPPRCPLCNCGPLPPAGLIERFKTGKWPEI